jgi:hypothetical protein
MNARWLLAIAILVFSFAAAYRAGMVAREWRKTPPVEVVEGLAIAATDLDTRSLGRERHRLASADPQPGRGDDRNPRHSRFVRLHFD